jgi:hypothetical protein
VTLDANGWDSATFKLRRASQQIFLTRVDHNLHVPSVMNLSGLQLFEELKEHRHPAKGILRPRRNT